MQLARGLEGAVVILLKRADQVLTPDAFAELGRSARAVCIDYVDGDHREPPSGPIDIAIAASRAAEGYLARRVKEPGWPGPAPAVRLLDHHADPRIAPRADAPGTRLRLAYFGAADNTVIPPEAAVDVACPAYDPATLGRDFFAAMSEANMHYAVRRPARPGNRVEFKPFTKGFNAAAAGAAVLVNRQVDDAETLLGADYPFFIPDASPAAIAAGIEHAHAAFGGPDWTRALTRMEEVRRLGSAEAVTAGLAAILDAAAAAR